MTRRHRPGSKTATYLLRFTPAEKAELERMAAAAGMTLAEALRVGAREWLQERVR